MKNVYIIEKVSNMIFITTPGDIVFYAWDESEFTQRKLNNAIKKLRNQHLDGITLINKL